MANLWLRKQPAHLWEGKYLLLLQRLPRNTVVLGQETTTMARARRGNLQVGFSPFSSPLTNHSALFRGGGVFISTPTRAANILELSNKRQECLAFSHSPILSRRLLASCGAKYITDDPARPGSNPMSRLRAVPKPRRRQGRQVSSTLFFSQPYVTTGPRHRVRPR